MDYKWLCYIAIDNFIISSMNNDKVILVINYLQTLVKAKPCIKHDKNLSKL